MQGFVNALDAMDVAPELSLGARDLRAWRDECCWIISIRNNPDFIAALGPMFYQGDERRTRNPVIGKGYKNTHSHTRRCGMSLRIQKASWITTVSLVNFL